MFSTNFNCSSKSIGPPGNAGQEKRIGVSLYQGWEKRRHASCARTKQQKSAHVRPVAAFDLFAVANGQSLHILTP